MTGGATRRRALLVGVSGAVALGPISVLGPSPARADETPSPVELQLAAPPEDIQPPTLADVDERLQRTESLVLNRQPVLTWGGYIDFGFFAPSGNGAGYVQDFGHASFPQYAGQYGWVFLGDILATAVNSRGEVADLGDAPGVDRASTAIHSGGAPGFIVNEVNLTLTRGASRQTAHRHRQRQLHAAHRQQLRARRLRSTSTSRRSSGCRPTTSARRSSSARSIR